MVEAVESRAGFGRFRSKFDPFRAKVSGKIWLASTEFGPLLAAYGPRSVEFCPTWLTADQTLSTATRIWPSSNRHRSTSALMRSLPSQSGLSCVDALFLKSLCARAFRATKRCLPSSAGCAATSRPNSPRTRPALGKEKACIPRTCAALVAEYRPWSARIPSNPKAV